MGKRQIRVVFALPVFFCALFIGISPVENLFFYELTAVHCSERGTGQIISVAFPGSVRMPEALIGKFSLILFARYDFQAPALLDDAEIADILGKVDVLTSWAADVKEYALQQAVSGKQWFGWKLVEGRSNRRYTDEAAVTQAVTNAGFDPYERKVLGITAMQKMLGKSRFEELLAPYIEKPQGKPTLVPESDKRPAMNTAKNDFMEEL